MKRLLCIPLLALCLSGCMLTNDSPHKYRNMGGFAGAIGGGMLANSFCGGMACQGIGVALGLLGGLAVGDTIDKIHYVHRRLATLEATSNMKQVSWAQQAGNGMQSATGTIFPKRKFLHNAHYRIGDDYHRVRGECVDFDEEIHLQESGKTIKTKGRACQTTDGEWRII